MHQTCIVHSISPTYKSNVLFFYFFRKNILSKALSWFLLLRSFSCVLAVLNCFVNKVVWISNYSLLLNQKCSKRPFIGNNGLYNSFLRWIGLVRMEIKENFCASGLSVYSCILYTVFDTIGFVAFDIQGK